MDTFRSTLIKSREVERSALKKELDGNLGPTEWEPIALSRTVVDFRPPNDGNDNKPKGYGNGYGYGIKSNKTTSPIKPQSNINMNTSSMYNDNYDNYYALESVANKLLSLGINIDDDTLLTLLNDDNDVQITNYNWEYLQERIHSYLGLKITKSEAQVLLTRLY